MPRTISAAIEAEKNKDENAPIELYQVFLDQETLYLAMFPKDIEFYDEQGSLQTYEAAALNRQPIRHNMDLSVDRTEVRIDNVARDMSAFLAFSEFQGRELAIWKVFLEWDPLTGEHSVIGGFEDRIELFHGIMDSPRIGEQAMAIDVVSSLDTLDKNLPGRVYSPLCTWTFGDPDTCGVTVETFSTEIFGISPDYREITFPENIAAEAGFWEFGTLTITRYVNGQPVAIYNRIIVESGLSHVVVEFPFPTDIEVGNEAFLEAGCDKAYDSGCEKWDNQEFYGGFISIPELQDVREVG